MIKNGIRFTLNKLKNIRAVDNLLFKCSIWLIMENDSKDSPGKIWQQWSEKYWMRNKKGYLIETRSKITLPINTFTFILTGIFLSSAVTQSFTVGFSLFLNTPEK